MTRSGGRAPRLNRREFVGAAAASAVVVRGSLVVPSEAVAAPRERPRFLYPNERRTANALFDELVPPIRGRGGAKAARAVDYLDYLLGADLRRPPLYHRGRFSGRTPYPGRCGPGKRFPRDGFRLYRRLQPAEMVAWKLRLDGSAAHPSLDPNSRTLGPVVGWRERYRAGLRELDQSSASLFGRRFADLQPPQREVVIAGADQSFIALAYSHAVEGTYSAPEYGGNAGLVGWRSIGFDGDRQPLGYVDPATGCELAPVSGPDAAAARASSVPALEPERVWQISSRALAAPHLTHDARVSPWKPKGAGSGGRARRRKPRRKRYDAVIVGSGPGASMAAFVLSKAGWHVLVLERGPNPYRELGRKVDSEFTNDELKAFQRRYGWPDPLIEPRTFRSSANGAPRSYVGPVNDLPAVVGGGAGLATMLVPRMREVDFLPRSRFGDVPGSIVVDWPIAYRDLAPDYEAVERLLGVQGRADDPAASPRRRPFPLRPGVPLWANEVIARGAERLGIPAPTAPLAINSKPYQGRPGCNECGRCWYYGCPIGAHGAMAPSVLGRAVATGRCRVGSQRFVSAIETAGGRATGVRYVDGGGRERAVGARFVLLGAGPIEDARLSLLSGLAGRDRSGLIGRGLVFHFQTFAGGYFSRERLHTRRGRGLARMITDFCGPPTLDESRRWGGTPGGGVVEISGLGLFGPISEGQTYPRGRAHADFMSANLFDDHLAGVLMQGEDLPQRETVVDLDPEVVDFRGMPVARLTYEPHPFEVEASSQYGQRLAEILLAAGADAVAYGPKNAPAGTSPQPLDLPDPIKSILNRLPGPSGAAAGPFAPTSPVPNTQHILSGFRMGHDPDLSVSDPSGRLHGFKNLYCVDGGLFCSSTPVNPTLTISALAHRVAKRLAGRLR